MSKYGSYVNITNLHLGHTKYSMLGLTPSPHIEFNYPDVTQVTK